MAAPTDDVASTGTDNSQPLPSQQFPVAEKAIDYYTEHADELPMLVRTLRNVRDGVKIKDRKYALRTYESCFVASELVDWLIANMKFESRETSVKFATFLQEQKLITHVSRERPFRDEKLWFRFVNKKKVIVLGGGFAGGTAAKKLEKYFDVTLINRTSYFECLPSLPVCAGDPTHITKIRSPHESFLKRTTLVVGEAKEVTPNSVQMEDGTRHDFDYLVVATGSRYVIPFKDSPLVVDPIKSDKLLAAYPAMLAARHVVIIGGGPVGIEIAGELIVRHPEKRYTIISAREILLERCCKGAHKNALKFFNSFPNVTVLLGEKVSGLQGNQLVTDKGRTLEDVDLVYPCIGFIPNTEPLRAHFSDALDPRTKLVLVDEYFRVCGYKNVFAVGDIISIDEEKLAQNAEKHAVVAANNILKLEKGKEERELDMYRPAQRFLIVSLGPKKALIVKGDTVLLDGSIAAKAKSVTEFKMMKTYS